MRYIIGIDLGTTNSAVAYVDTTKERYPVQLLSIPQLTSLGRVESQSTLPSFCYLIFKEEWPPGSLKLPWKEETSTFVGQFGKLQGAKVPTRLIQSAKSWLCNVAANRKDRILPIEASDSSYRLSPLEASAKYLNHIKDAWNATVAKGNSESQFEEQEIILTVPASFDEVARALTVEAARQAGILNLTLLEEPQAAFYSWISHHEKSWEKKFVNGDSILICDVGGGTTDFSLIEVVEKNSQKSFQRMAVGDHLLLGGDNMDRTIAHYLEEKMKEQNQPSLEPSQWQQFYAEGRRAKEELLDPHGNKTAHTLSIQGIGSSVIKGSRTLEVEKSEIEKLLLTGFFSLYPLEEALKLNKSRGMRTMGLPYEDEPSITKHLAHFLQQANYLGKKINYLLFNGGTMKPRLFQEAIHQSLKNWYHGDSPELLDTVSLDLAVAYGAAYYGKAKRGIGVKIQGGIPRTYYLKVDVQQGNNTNQKAFTLLTRGSEEGDTFKLDQIFSLRPNQPVSFNLLSSHVRLNDHQSNLIDIDEHEMQMLPPIHTVLRFGKKQLAGDQIHETIPVQLGIKLTPIGTLEIWLDSINSDHRWNLEFQLRSLSGSEAVTDRREISLDETFGTNYLNDAEKLISELFYPVGSIKPDKIMEKLESLFDKERRLWSSTLLRGLWDLLYKFAPSRKISTEHEARWWNLAGFFLRPGFGFPLDDYRMKEFWKIILPELKIPKASEIQLQQWICFRRVSGGFSKGQQTQIASELAQGLFGKNNKIEIKNKNELYHYSEKIRVLASFERLEIPLKIKLGEAILDRIYRNEANQYDYWALGRLGARHFLYGSIAQVIPRETCEKWIEKLLTIEFLNQKTAIQEDLKFCLIQLARKTDHREINISEAIVNKILSKYDSIKDNLLNQRELTDIEEEKLLGDRLPSGIVLHL